jgi:hypothetical protein|tara:strand:- start:1154 stop:1465 length:312 start_codon:yes stop_codon:yes gene_type:complete
MTAPIKWKIKDGDGDYIKYKEGDIVSKNGKIYAALRNTDVREGSPEHGEKAGWKPYTDNRIKKYTEDSSEPINPTVGDEWYDSSKGILFKYINDGTSTQWVEI